MSHCVIMLVTKLVYDWNIKLLLHISYNIHTALIIIYNEWFWYIINKPKVILQNLEKIYQILCICISDLNFVIKRNVQSTTLTFADCTVLYLV